MHIGKGHIFGQAAAMIMLVFLASGCDFFRKLAGRPDSAYIEAKRLYIEQQEAEHRSRVDSVRELSSSIADSLSLLDSIRIGRKAVIEKRQLVSDGVQKLGARYYIIIGSFSKESNAQKLAETARSNGFEPSLIRYKNGFTAVGICPCNRLSDVLAALDGLNGLSFVPKGVWVLDNE